MSFLRNTWYVAAWADEVRAGAMLSRRFLDELVVLFRDDADVVRALADRCAHRFVPLSMGTLLDGGRAIQCRYHGLRFDATGACVHNPQGAAPPARARVHAYPVVERYGIVWIWMGDAARADASLVPDFSFMDPATHYVATSSMTVAAHYELESDNILDLSHIEFLHPIFSSPRVSSAPCVCEQDGLTVWSKRHITDDLLPEFLQNAFGFAAGERSDRWLDVRWNAPACLAIWSGAVRAGRSRDEGHVLPGAHLFTPETATSTHYFFGSGLPRALGPFAEAAVQHAVAAGADPNGPFHAEDKPMIEAQARAMGARDLWAMKPAILPGDEPALAARRVLAKLIADEGIAAAR